jgi:hypothetical protein
LVKSEGLNSSSGSEVQITAAGRYRRLTSDHFVCANLRKLVFDLSYFHAIAVDFHTQV